jgi:outer membrane protein
MKHVLLTITALCVAAAPLSAKDYRVRVGLGAQVRPEWRGSDDYEVGPLWDIDVARGSNPFKFEAEDDPFGISLISKNGFSFGPAANIEWKRKESDVGAPLGNVKTTFEAGGFVQYYPSKSIRLRADLRKGLGGHGGLVGSVGADWIARDGDRYVFSIGPRVLFSDRKYERAYFGVTPEAALASGLPAYRPDSGIHAVAAESNLSYQFNNRFGMFGYARYERLVGDAGRSPIIREFGSRNQWSAGAGLSYTFDVRL